MWAASKAAVSLGPATYVTAASLTVVISVSPIAAVPVIVAWQRAGTGGAAT